MSRKCRDFFKQESVVEIYLLLSQITFLKVWKMQQFCTNIVQKQLLTGKNSIIYFLMSQITVVKVGKIQQFCTSIVQKLLTGKSSIIYLLMSQITIVKVGKIRQYRANFFYVIFETGKLCRNVLIYGTKYDSNFWKIQ